VLIGPEATVNVTKPGVISSPSPSVSRNYFDWAHSSPASPIPSRVRWVGEVMVFLYAEDRKPSNDLNSY
jgi:hypothetical protein